MLSQKELKQQVAIKALEYIEDEQIIGIGSGSTVDAFIEALVKVKSRIDACVSSSNASTAKLRALGFSVLDMNVVGELPLYFDGADEINPRGEMKKGGGGALTREKILATYAKKFICMVDDSKQKNLWGDFPIAIEVIPCARSAVGREILKMGASPEYRHDFISDNGNIILDVYQLDMLAPLEMEGRLNQIVGVVENGIFAARKADLVLVASQNGIQVLNID
jgi:ribose 5-phosphate isomerase A